MSQKGFFSIFPKVTKGLKLALCIKAGIKIAVVVFLAVTAGGCKTTQTLADAAAPPAPQPIAPKPAAPKPAVAGKTLQEKKLAFALQVQDKLKTGALKDALATWDKADEALQSDYDMRVLKTSILLADGQSERAGTELAAMLHEKPSDVSLMVMSAMVEKSKGDSKKQLEMLQKAIKIEPKNAAVNTEMGAYYMIKRNFALAKKYYETAKTTNPNDETALVGYGESCYYTNNLLEARVVFTAVVAKNPKNGQAIANLAKLDFESDNFKKAVDGYAEALKYAPDQYAYWIDYGKALQRYGRPQEAIKAWNKAASLSPNYFLAYTHLAGIYDQSDNIPSAITNYKKVIELNPGYYFAYEPLGMFAWHEGNWREARFFFLSAYKANPSNVFYSLLVAATYLKENDAKSSKDFLTQVMTTMNKASTEYAIVRLYFDGLADTAVAQKISKEANSNVRGKFMYYMGLFYELNNNTILAEKYYQDVYDLKAPMFFEYRLNDWALTGIKTKTETETKTARKG
ncbi:MAG: hypothetical protein Ta2A_16970 [Treponemataceae bacterium]|nr:MAG: hypothetical protein Ta2A_16970 [Treponemataceae bacterium]